MSLRRTAASVDLLLSQLRARADGATKAAARTTKARGKKALAVKMTKPVGPTPCFYQIECGLSVQEPIFLARERTWRFLCSTHQSS